MNPNNWLERFLFVHTRQSRPDGRPLYAYKCRNEDYDKLKPIVREMLLKELKELRGYQPLNFNPMFCLYAAETWRRRHDGGPWKWETVFLEVCKWIPNYPQIHKWVRDGLFYWRRPILKSEIGHNEYLVTIACEGGLPLLLLRKENAHLYRYFKNLLEAYHLERLLPTHDVTAIAHRLSSHLPRSLRHDIVYNLGGDLVRKVVDLQELIPEAVDPIIALNRCRENWRDDLPLPLDDSTVELLLKNLVNEARTLAISERQQVRWRRRLLENGGEWNIEQRLDMPNIFTGAALRRWTNRQDVVPRLRILLQTPHGIEPVALITRLRGEGDDASYRCEVLKRNGVRIFGANALADIRLLVSDGISEYELTVKGGEEWGPLPWIFGERDGQWEYIREGSARCRDNTVQALLPLNGWCEEMDGECILIGSAPDLQREVWLFSGTVLWRHPQLGACRIQCASQDATEDVLLLDGKRFLSTTDQTPPFLGPPSLYAVDPNGVRRGLNDVPMEWRTCKGGDASWYRGSKTCSGEVWIRYTDPNGDQLLRRKVRIVPVTTQTEIVQIGINENPGRLRLTGLAGAQVCCIDKAGCRFQQEPLVDGAVIDCFADAGLPVTDFSIKLFWSDGRSLELNLPFPRTGGAFVCAGEVLPDGERVPVARLAAIQAVAQAPAGGQHFDLAIKIMTKTNQWHQIWLREPLAVGNDGRSLFFLHRLQERLSSLLALTGELDSMAIFEILQHGNHCLARLEVGQFDMSLEPDWENRQVVLPQACQDRFDEGWEHRVSMRMVPLWAPATEPIALNRSSSRIAWDIPGNLGPGPWWVLGEDGDWARFRPLLWNISGEAEIGNSPLERAIRQIDQDTRQEMLRLWVDQIALDPEHPDWTTFFDLLRLIRPYPACALDLFPYIVKSPEAMVLALLLSSDDDFDAVWSLTYQLPFSWYLVPINAWMTSGSRYFGALNLGLTEIDHGGELLWDQFQTFRERVTNRRPFFRQISDWLCNKIFPERLLQNSELAIAQKHPEIIEKFIMEEELKLQARHDSEERYPAGSLIMRWTDSPDYPERYRYRHLSKPFRPIRCAPFVAAYISLQGAEYDNELLFELKTMRDFDREWFKAAYAFALCLGLGQRLKEAYGDLA